ncbi:MAG: DUF1553 domain-containing protein [Bryobacterales bacterium]|nr:DUF1553 domain-containing protein [Bryobacterales bacterium]
MRSNYRRTICVLVCLAVLAPPAASEQKAVSAAECTFRADPDAFLAGQARARQAANERAARLGKSPARSAAGGATPAALIPQRGFIDAEIFGKMAAQNVLSAPLAGDEEFLRRLMLDLTGRIPSPADIREFLADRSPDKRDRLIDRLTGSPEFVDKWTLWLGDLLQNTAVSTNVSRQIGGRNAFHNWIRGSIADNQPLWRMAYEAVTGDGMNFDNARGASNYAVGATTPAGPLQDTYDAMLYRSATAFLGISHYDCLLCHNGRGHLDAISLWGSRTTRLEAQRMAAFFSRTRMTRQGNQALDYYNSYTVTDVATGTYNLNTNYGNRPIRSAPTIQGRPLVNLTPEYLPTGAAPKHEYWRPAFAEFMLGDPMFARNMANRLWKQMFNLGLAEPVDALDPARMDPDNPPPAPWTLQATHPRLLERLARELRDGNFDLRAYLRLLAQSSAYQLSSRYEAEWKLDYVPLFARHYPRRLEGEEVHDAVVKATGVAAKHTVGFWPEPVEWAMQLPEPAEPRSNGAVLNFMNTFLRGNRDNQPRRQGGSILQQLSMMNDAFTVTRVKKAASPTLQAAARLASNQAVVEELFLLFLSHKPNDYERERAVAFLARAATPAARDAAIEDLAWVCMNKVDFLFSY